MMRHALSFTLAILLALAGNLAHAHGGRPSRPVMSHLKCYQVGSLIQVGNEEQCSIPVVAKTETLRLCLDRAEISYDEKDPSFKRGSFQVSLIKGRHTLIRENFKSRYEIVGDSLTYFYSQAKNASEFNEGDRTNLKMEVTKKTVDKRPVLLGKIVVQNQLYCF